MSDSHAKTDSAARLDTRPILAAISELVERALAGRDDEPAIRGKLADGSASLRFAFDSDSSILVIGIKAAHRVEQLDALVAEGEHAGRRLVDVAFELSDSRASH